LHDVARGRSQPTTNPSPIRLPSIARERRMSTREDDAMQQTKQIRPCHSRTPIAAAICLCSASSMAHAGTALSTAALAVATNAQHARSVPAMTLTLTAPPPPQRQQLAFDAPRQGIVGRESAPQFASSDTEHAVAFPIPWQKRTEIERVVRNFRHNGLPLVRLWGEGRNLLAIGLNPHGVPGIYFTQKLPD
jgi:hypothetical protein